MPSVVCARACSFCTTQPTSSLEVGFQCGLLDLLLDAFASVAGNRSHREPEIGGVGFYCESPINSPCGVVGSAPGIHLPRRLRSSWRLSRLPKGLGYHQSLLPISVTAWIHVTWMALPLSGTSPDVFVCILSVVSTALAFFMHQLWCSWIVRCTSI